MRSLRPGQRKRSPVCVPSPSPFAESHPDGTGGHPEHPPARRGRARVGEGGEPGATEAAGESQRDSPDRRSKT